MDYESRRSLMRRLVLYSPQLSRAMLAGDFRSAFKGRGVDFDGLREYEISDDALRIDWNSTVRHGHPFVKTYVDDRGLSVYIIIDRSASMHFGSGRTKYDTASLSAALLAHACLLNNVQVGGLLFGASPFAGGSLLEAVPKTANPSGIRRFIKALLTGSIYEQAHTDVPAADDSRSASVSGGSPLTEALRLAGSLLDRHTMVFVFSDYLVKDYSRSLALLARRHDMVCVLVKDELDTAIPAKQLFLRAMDAESGRRSACAPGSVDYRRQWATVARERRLDWLSALRSAHLPSLELDGCVDPAWALIHFFDRRRGGRYV